MLPDKIVRPDRVEYWVNGCYHREDGPSLTWNNGMSYWDLYDYEVSLLKYKETLLLINYMKNKRHLNIG